QVSAARALWEIFVPAKQDARGIAPVLGERRLQEADHGSLDPDVGLPPVSLLSAVALPPAADTGPARETDLSIDHEHPAVIAMIDPLDRERVQRVKPGKVTAGLGQLRPI